MSRTLLAAVCALLGTGSQLSAGPVLDDMDEIRFRVPEKGKTELVEGKVGANR